MLHWWPRLSSPRMQSSSTSCRQSRQLLRTQRPVQFAVSKTGEVPPPGATASRLACSPARPCTDARRSVELAGPRRVHGRGVAVHCCMVASVCRLPARDNTDMSQRGLHIPLYVKRSQGRHQPTRLLSGADGHLFAGVAAAPRQPAPPPKLQLRT